ncbi:MAG TPA: peptidoglycan DD-metalloendopeptidase family protein [Actinobacteria bacterium]|jgi:murein DD-endopeptidase MepM/ murein hydrolase activator NlpD|nr:peptidoglycan DD-metalloendopeptidase family protein [Actinomycetota bacterium]
MIMKKRSNLIVAISIFICVLIIFTIIPVAPLSGGSLEDQLEQIKKEKEETKKKIEDAKKKEQEYLGQVNKVEDQLLSSLDQLNDLNTNLADVKSNIDKTTIDLAIKESELLEINKELDAKSTILNNRVASIYKNGNTNILDVIFKAQSFTELLSKLKLMNLLADQDAVIIEEIKDKKNATLSVQQSIMELQKKQNEQKSNLEKLVTQAEQKKTEISGILDEKKSLLSSAKADKNALIAMEAQLTAKETEIQRILESLRYGSAPNGRLQWPTAGKLISGFGNRRHPIFGGTRFHSGVDLAAPSGTPIIAADGGEVLQASYSGGYGYSILIYHGGGFATFYAHMSSFAVGQGQMVKRGQVIGYVGTTGWTTGPHLHFEVRINGAAQNPMGYL